MFKPIEFRGSSLDDLRNFPQDARREAGLQLDRVQRGLEPNDWKPLKSVGAGAREIRLSETDGTFRIIYVAKFEDVIFVLHCFQKKTKKAAQPDIDLAKERYKALLRRKK